jgi:flagellar biosynthesis/type III secretory pathway chaperone
MMNYTALDLLKKQQDSLITLTKILKDEFEILKSRDRSYLAQNAEKKNYRIKYNKRCRSSD